MSITPLMPVYPRCGFRPVRGEGAWLISEDGSRALDFAAGIAVNLLGHSHPHLTKAIQDQAATLIHVSNLYGSPQGKPLPSGLWIPPLPIRYSLPIPALRRWSALLKPPVPITKAKAVTALRSSPLRTPFTAGRWRRFRPAIRRRCTRASCLCWKVSNMLILTILRAQRLPWGQKPLRFWLSLFRGGWSAPCIRCLYARPSDFGR